MSKQLRWALVASGSALLAAAIARKTLRGGWRVVMKEEPPEDPTSPGTPWGQALMWSAASTVTAGAARMLAKRGAEAGWRAIVGEAPPDA